MSDLTLSEYQVLAAKTAQYPAMHGKQYTALGLLGELGEVANKYKKVLRGDYTFDDIRPDLADELGDCFWYCVMLAKECKYAFRPLLDAPCEANPDEFRRHFTNAIHYATFEFVATPGAKETGYQQALFHIWRAAYALGYTPFEIMQRNLDKLASRQERGVIQGNGDKR